MRIVTASIGVSSESTAPLERALQRIGAPFVTLDVGDAAVRALYEAKVLLVRPDGHVAWRGDSTSHDPDVVAAMAAGHLARVGRP